MNASGATPDIDYIDHTALITGRPRRDLGPL